MRKLLLLTLVTLLTCTTHAQDYVQKYVDDESRTKWLMETNKDPMTDSIIITVSRLADKPINFTFNPPSDTELIIKHSRQITTFILQVSKVEFADLDSSYINIRFDKEPMESYRYHFPVTGHKSLISVYGGQDILDKLRKASKMLIQANFKDEGQYIMEFHVDHYPFP